MVYMGGQQMARGEGSGVFDPVKHGKNVLYLPRIERDPSSLAALIPAQTLTMASGTYFPCDASASSGNGRGIAPAATACCLRSFEQLYRPSYDFQGFLDSSAFNRAVPSGTCSATNGINDTFPLSDVVLDLPSTNGQGTNDLVVGQIEGMPSSEVRLLETIDYTTRTFRVLLVLEEGDLIAKAVGQGKAALMRNHGHITVGHSVEEAVAWFIRMERACEQTLLARAAGKPHVLDHETAALTASQIGSHRAGWYGLQPLVDKVLAEQPDVLN
jgi:hypothetical protein